MNSGGRSIWSMLCWPRARRPKPVGNLEMQRLSSSLPLVLVAVLAACGGGGEQRQRSRASDVAVVGHTHIAKAQFDALLEQAKQSYKSQGQTFPKEGTSDYETVKSRGDLAARAAGRARGRGDDARHQRHRQADQTPASPRSRSSTSRTDEKKYERLPQAEQAHRTTVVREDVREQLISQSRLRQRHEERDGVQPGRPQLLPAAHLAVLAAADAGRALHPRQEEGDRRLRSTAS